MVNNPLSQDTSLVFFPDEKPQNMTSNVNVVIGDLNAPISVALTWDAITPGFNAIRYSRRNETLLLEVARNYVRKINFSELNEALEDEEISLEEYEKELESKSDKYAITLKNFNSPEDIHNIIDLANKIGLNLRDFSASEVAEMFSIKENDLIKAASACYYQTK